MSGADWSLPELLADFRAKIEAELASARKLGHAVDKGGASEATWIDMLNHYLPERYQARKRHVVDAKGQKLRGCDLAKIKISDLVGGGELRTRAMVIQQKTSRPAQFEIMTDARGSPLA